MFDLRSLLGENVESARLELTLQQPPTLEFAIDAHRVLAEWTEAAVTWDTRAAGESWTNSGVDYSSSATASATVAPSDAGQTVVSWDVTTDVAA